MTTIFGSWYVQEEISHTPDGDKRRHYSVGRILHVGQDNREWNSGDKGFPTFEEAKAWVLQQPGATE